ncbi:MAG: NYN domain-containing protein [Gemmatimonadaceae bacterium]|nr:NYN domain-containing protein [Gemmatimonadaceae bacterium]
MTPRPSRAAHPIARRPVAPVHRGPQAVSSNVGGPIHHAPNACLLIDFDNVTMGIRSDLQTELRNLLSSDIVKGKVAVQRAYADWRRYPQYVVPLTESSIDLIFAAAYGSAKKNATDIRLAIDAMELVFVRPEIGTFILLSGDSDFSSLVIKLKEYGKYVIGVGIRESSSDLLVQNCDEYYSYNALAGLVKFGEEESVKWDPWKLVTEAIGRMTKNGDVMRADRLKQVMQTIDSSFDEKNLGMAKFSRFVQDAAQKGLIALTRLQNGQMEVGPPTAPGAAIEAPKAAETVSPAVAAASPTDDAKRGRRGGRGRDRGRPRREDAPSAAAGTPQATDAPVAAPAAAVAAPAAAPAPAAAVSDGIGSSGIRLTRDEAFQLVRRAVASLVSGNASVPALKVRTAARDMLGRDSESLSERNFTRILQDAHDADVVDLRKRGGDYEVAGSATAAPVAQQLADTTPPPAKSAAPPVHQKTMGNRVVRGRNPFGSKTPAGVPANLLSVGVVGTPKAVVAAPSATELPNVSDNPVTQDSPASEAAPAKRPARGPRKPKASVEGDSPKPTRARTKRAPRSRAKTASTPPGEE